MTRGLPRAHAEFRFYHSFELPTRPKWRKGCSARSRICILPQFWASDTSEVTKGLIGDVTCVLPQFWASDTSEVTKGLIGDVTNLRLFYHSFERPTRPKWRKGRSATWKICVLPQFWTSETSEVMKGSIGDVKNLRFTTVLSVQHARSDERVVKSTGAIPAPRQKKNIF